LYPRLALGFSRAAYRNTVQDDTLEGTKNTVWDGVFKWRFLKNAFWHERPDPMRSSLSASSSQNLHVRDGAVCVILSFL
jgi:hypothetical protein